MTEPRLPPHITEDDIKLLTEIVTPSIVEAVLTVLTDQQHPDSEQRPDSHWATYGRRMARVIDNLARNVVWSEERIELYRPDGSAKTNEEIRLEAAAIRSRSQADTTEWEYISVAPDRFRCPATEGGGVQCRHFADTDHQHEVHEDGPVGSNSRIARRRKSGQWEAFNG